MQQRDPRFPQRNQPTVTANVHIDPITTVTVDAENYTLAIGDLYDQRVEVNLFLGTTDEQSIDTIENLMMPKLRELADRIRRKNSGLRVVPAEEPIEERSN